MATPLRPLLGHPTDRGSRTGVPWVLSSWGPEFNPTGPRELGLELSGH